MIGWVTISPFNDRPEEPGQIEFSLTKEERDYARGCMAIAKARLAKLDREQEVKMLAKALKEMDDEA